MARTLQLEAASSDYSKALMDLTHEVHEKGCAQEWLDMVDAEYAFLIVMTRRVSEQRREAAEAARKDQEAK